MSGSRSINGGGGGLHYPGSWDARHHARAIAGRYAAEESSGHHGAARGLRRVFARNREQPHHGCRPLSPVAHLLAMAGATHGGHPSCRDSGVFLPLALRAKRRHKRGAPRALTFQPPSLRACGDSAVTLEKSCRMFWGKVGSVGLRLQHLLSTWPLREPARAT